MTSRKATDVLLKIEQMIEKVLGHNRNQDLLIKTLMNRIQVLEDKIDGIKNVPVQAQQPVAASQQEFPKHSGDAPPRRINQQLPGLKPSVKINNPQQPQNSGFDFRNTEQNRQSSNRQITRDPNEEDEAEKLELDAKPQGKRRDSRYIPSSYDGKPVPVQQKLLYPDGRAISTAKVEVFDDKSNLVKTLKTNATGKWTNALPPGNYTIQVSKKGTSTKNAVEAQVEITVPTSSEPVQLKPFQVL